MLGLRRSPDGEPSTGPGLSVGSVNVNSHDSDRPSQAGLGHSDLSDLACWDSCSSTKRGEITERPDDSPVTVPAPQLSPTGVLGALLHGLPLTLGHRPGPPAGTGWTSVLGCCQDKQRGQRTRGRGGRPFSLQSRRATTHPAGPWGPDGGLGVRTVTGPSPGLQDHQAQRSAASLAAVGVESGLKEDVHEQGSGWRLGAHAHAR